MFVFILFCFFPRYVILYDDPWGTPSTNLVECPLLLSFLVPGSQQFAKYPVVFVKETSGSKWSLILETDNYRVTFKEMERKEKVSEIREPLDDWYEGMLGMKRILNAWWWWWWIVIVTLLKAAQWTSTQYNANRRERSRIIKPTLCISGKSAATEMCFN